MQIKQTVTREVEEIVSTTCNACGETKPDTTHVHASGGYDSTALFDMQHYEFDLCEECLVAVMMGLKIPPLVTGESWGDAPLTWENDRAQFKKSHERSAAQEQAEHAAQEAGVCGRRVRDAKGQYSDKLCGAQPAMRVNFDGRGFEPVCLSHGVDAYTSRYALIERDGVTSSFSDRSRIGNTYLRALLENKPPLIERDIRPDQKTSDHVRTICVATCFPLLMQPKWAFIAMRELHRLTDAAPQPVRQWTNHRLPHRFAPGDEVATLANAWLAWGRDQGFLEATAHGFIGCNATCLWTEEDTRDSEDDV